MQKIFLTNSIDYRFIVYSSSKSTGSNARSGGQEIRIGKGSKDGNLDFSSMLRDKMDEMSMGVR